MTAIVTRCKSCGTEFEPDRAAIVAGVWQTCPACRLLDFVAATGETTCCSECGRPLRAGQRSICVGCLTGWTAL